MDTRVGSKCRATIVILILELSQDRLGVKVSFLLYFLYFYFAISIIIAMMLLVWES